MSSINKFVDIEFKKLECINKYSSIPEIKDMLIYAISGGKNLRSKIFLELVDIWLFFVLKSSSLDEDFKTVKELIQGCFVTIEFTHIASLILDDCPAMDNDYLRRDKPSFHAKYGVAKAQMCSLILIEIAQKAFSDNILKLYEMKFYSAEDLIDIKTNFDINLGEKGLCGGQLLDLFFLKTEPSYKKYLKMIKYKTGRLFELSFVLPYILCKKFVVMSSRDSSLTSLYTEREVKAESLVKVIGSFSTSLSLSTDKDKDLSIDKDKDLSIDKMEDLSIDKMEDPIQDIKRCGKILGLIFQIRDDMFDNDEDLNCNNILNYKTRDEVKNIIIPDLINRFNSLNKVNIPNSIKEYL